ncbi:MAG: hypothetical protein U9P10_14235 [Thermodesulfobacteriota bacterium]|nr:hypothetical protein [Thermodesulfobacteriota bacterium]
MKINDETLSFNDLTEHIFRYWRKFGEAIVLDGNGRILKSGIGPNAGHCK